MENSVLQLQRNVITQKRVFFKDTKINSIEFNGVLYAGWNMKQCL